jgi:hypothetical protein
MFVMQIGALHSPFSKGSTAVNFRCVLISEFYQCPMSPQAMFRTHKADTVCRMWYTRTDLVRWRLPLHWRLSLKYCPGFQYRIPSINPNRLLKVVVKKGIRMKTGKKDRNKYMLTSFRAYKNLLLLPVGLRVGQRTHVHAHTHMRTHALLW